MIRNTVVVLFTALLLTACQPRHHDTSAPDVQSGHVLVTELPGSMEQLRRINQPDNDQRREAILSLLTEAGFDATLQEFPNIGRGGDTRETGHNIIVDIGTGERDLIIGGHYDRVSVGEGMVDNGASIIVLLHAMRAVRGMALEHRVRFVLFDLEEVGLVGARYFASNIEPERTVAMINLDVNGYGDTVFYGHTAHGHVHLYDALHRGCGRLLLRCVDFPIYPPSDNLAFQRTAIPNISLSVLPVTEVHQLWLMMNAREHSGMADGFLPGVFLTIHTQGDTYAQVESAAMTLSYNALMGLLDELSSTTHE